MDRFCCYSLTRNEDDGSDPHPRAAVKMPVPASAPASSARAPPVRPPRPASLGLPVSATQPSLRPNRTGSSMTMGPLGIKCTVDAPKKGKTKANDNEMQRENKSPQKGYIGVRSSYAGRAAHSAVSGSRVAIPPPDVVVADRKAMLRRMREQHEMAGTADPEDVIKSQHPAVREAAANREAHSMASQRSLRNIASKASLRIFKS